jgi:hypothetical protein
VALVGAVVGAGAAAEVADVTVGAAVAAAWGGAD